MPKPSAIQRFTSAYRIDAKGCWVWQGYLSRGYAPFVDKTVRSYAHRWSYEHFVGPIPEGLQIDHLCRNRACVNPEHLEPVTCRENLLRGDTFQARNAAKTHCPQGHPYSGDNLYVNPTGGRVCRICSRHFAVLQRKRRPRPPGLYDEERICTVCGSLFSTSKHHRAHTCSRSCADVVRLETRRAA